MLLDFLFQIWRRLNSNLQWRVLWLASNKFMLTVSGVIFDDSGQILLQRHRNWVHEVWGLPGGIVQHGETLENAIAREVREETNLVITGVEWVRVVSDYRIRVEHYFRACLDDTVKPQVIRLQESEVLEARFFPVSNLPDNILPLQREIIEIAAAGNSASL